MMNRSRTASLDPIIFATGMVLLVSFPPLGIPILCISAFVFAAKRSKAKAAHARAAQVLMVRRRQQRIIAWKSIP